MIGLISSSSCNKKSHLEKFVKPKQYKWRMKISQWPKISHRIAPECYWVCRYLMTTVIKTCKVFEYMILSFVKAKFSVRFTWLKSCVPKFSHADARCNVCSVKNDIKGSSNTLLHLVSFFYGTDVKIKFPRAEYLTCQKSKLPSCKSQSSLFFKIKKWTKLNSKIR